MVHLAENEIENFVKVWLTVFVSLTYCYIIGKVTIKGVTRLILILPVIFLFLVLPLNITSIHLCGLTSFFVSWLANFKLLLFAFGKPPLSLDIPLSFPYFISVSCLPIKLQNDLTREKPAKFIDQKELQNSRNKPDPDTKKLQNDMTREKPAKSKISTIDDLDQKELQNSQNKPDPDNKTVSKSYPSTQNPKKLQKKSPWNYIIKVTLLLIMIKLYDYSDEMPKRLLWVIYGFNIYFALEIILAFVAKAANVFIGLDLEPTFDEPLLATSLQDFWGRRWNLMVTSILRPTIYLPTFELTSKCKYIGCDIAKLLAVIATFGVSAIYHELIFYYLGRKKPTFQVTWFFLLHGFCVCLEAIIGKYFGCKIKVPRLISGVATIGFVIVTGVWLFMPPLVRAGLATKGLHEYAVVAGFVKHYVTVICM